MHTWPVMETILLFRFVVLALYLAASVAYIALLLNGRKRENTPTRIFAAGLTAHLVEVILRGAEAGAAGGAPFATLSGFLSLFAFLLGITYLGLERRYKVSSLGAFHVPVLFAIHAWSAFIKLPLAAIPDLRRGPFFVFHVVPAIFAYAALTAGAVAGVAYLLLERQIRSKRSGILMRGLPHLDLVEKVNAAAVKVGAPLLALGAFIGIFKGYAFLGASFTWDPKVWLTLVMIAIFSVQLVLRRYAGWAGRRTVSISLVGFIVLIVCVTLINIYFSKIHGFDC